MMSDFKQIIDNISNIENLDNTTILKILEKFDKEISKYAEKQSGLSHISNVDFIPIENGLTYADGEVDIFGTLKFTIENNVVVEKPANIKLNIKGDSYIVVDSDETGNSLVIREDDELYHKVESFSNPNLLINGDFGVNQRGQTTYTGNNIYCVDRCIVRSAKVDVLSKGIKITQNGEQYFGINQSIENFSNLSGKTVTLSVKISDFNMVNDRLYIAIGNSQNALNRGTTLGIFENINANGIYKLTVDIPSVLSNPCLNVMVQNQGGNTTNTNNFSVEWYKLEIGSVATQNSPRPYAEELAMCQRYYQVIKTQSGLTMLNLAFARTSLSARIVVNLTQSLRTSPTIKNSNCTLFNIKTNVSVAITDNSLSRTCLSNNQIVLNYETTDLTQGDLFFVSDTNGLGKIELDAEIY